jgi:hypothetical protein
LAGSAGLKRASKKPSNPCVDYPILLFDTEVARYTPP